MLTKHSKVKNIFITQSISPEFSQDTPQFAHKETMGFSMEFKKWFQNNTDNNDYSKHKRRK